MALAGFGRNKGKKGKNRRHWVLRKNKERGRKKHKENILHKKGTALGGERLVLQVLCWASIARPLKP